MLYSYLLEGCLLCKLILHLLCLEQHQVMGWGELTDSAVSVVVVYELAGFAMRACA